MVKKIDDQTLDRAIVSLWDDYTFSVGKTELGMHKEYRLSSGESLQDECFSVSLYENTPENHVQKLPREFEGYKVFYKVEKKPEPQS